MRASLAATSKHVLYRSKFLNFPIRDLLLNNKLMIQWVSTWFEPAVLIGSLKKYWPVIGRMLEGESVEIARHYVGCIEDESLLWLVACRAIVLIKHQSSVKQVYHFNVTWLIRIVWLAGGCHVIVVVGCDWLMWDGLVMVPYVEVDVKLLFGSIELVGNCVFVICTNALFDTAILG